MAKLFQKSLLLCVSKYSLYNSFNGILSELSLDHKGYDIRAKAGNLNQKIQTQIFRFPYKIRNKWERNFLTRINLDIINEMSTYKPDLVFVYNSEYLLPETCAEIKKKSKLIFFMGDSPFYTPVNNYYLTCLTYADLILSPDSFWNYQLNTMGFKKTSFFVPGIDLGSYHILPESDLTEDDFKELDILYTGSGYVNSWGYKKALLMSQFTAFNFRLYGNKAWERWFQFFPELKSSYIPSDYIPTEKLNKMYNRSRLIPVDGNPGILNGFHLRLLEVLGAGSLPLVEFRNDTNNLLFKECKAKAPEIRDYSKAGEIAEYYLKHENERADLSKTLRTFLLENYSPQKNADRILNLLSE